MEFYNLERGDIITSKLTDEVAIVTGDYGSRITAVKTFDITNPVEWSVTLKANHKKPEYKSEFSIYQEKGFKNRNDYLESLADVYGVSVDKVLSISVLLGSSEDFDGLVSSLKDMYQENDPCNADKFCGTCKAPINNGCMNCDTCGVCLKVNLHRKEQQL